LHIPQADGPTPMRCHGESLARLSGLIVLCRLPLDRKYVPVASYSVSCPDTIASNGTGSVPSRFQVETPLRSRPIGTAGHFLVNQSSGYSDLANRQVFWIRHDFCSLRRNPQIFPFQRNASAAQCNQITIPTCFQFNPTGTVTATDRVGIS